MEVWEWLRPWWNWWAGFTDLFDWEAIAALATLLAVIVALGTTWYQERQRRSSIQRISKDALSRGRIAIQRAVETFYSAGAVDLEHVSRSDLKVKRAKRMIEFHAPRETEPEMLMAMLQMDDHLSEAQRVLELARKGALAGVENAMFNGDLNATLSAAEKLVARYG